MNDRKCFELLDKALRDITNNHNRPFGGKSILLGGDFRQTLPIKPKASKTEILASCITRSYLWRFFKTFTLTRNMRLTDSGQDTSWFSKWLLDIGDGKIGHTKEHCTDAKIVEIPDQLLIQPSKTALSELISFVYTKEMLHSPTPTDIATRAIICPRNDTVDEINKLILNMSSDTLQTYLSTDSMIPHSKNGGVTDLMYPVDYLNLLNFPGIPNHSLTLKKNTPVMLLRNIDQKNGLCNGTRLLVSQLLPTVIEAHIITGTSINRRVYIPRITFVHNNKELPFIFKRRQFPLRPCYAMTINKSQGQSLNRIGIYLRQPIFGHGQLYVALSRTTSPTGLKVLIEHEQYEKPNTIVNIVYSDYLHDIQIEQVVGLFVTLIF
uniref:ATP-dependent DNA helicase PIF1-like n=1 Tax=Erigeron canadensis TaxID=72917 RepID=UPI001CB8A873|nr:ATP-dependent DNA helicase PIF1-like [Erigeron canadensis]